MGRSPRSTVWYEARFGGGISGGSLVLVLLKGLLHRDVRLPQRSLGFLMGWYKGGLELYLVATTCDCACDPA